MPVLYSTVVAIGQQEVRFAALTVAADTGSEVAAVAHSGYRKADWAARQVDTAEQEVALSAVDTVAA